MSTFRSMLEGLGQQIVQEKEKELEMRCPFHEDKHPSFYVNKLTGSWFCHSGCGGGSFFDLYERLKSFGAEPIVRTRGDAPVPLDMGLEVLVKRGFTPAMLERWEIAYNDDIGAIEIPCYDVADKLLGYICRMPEGVHPKYRLPEGFQKKSVLFGMHKILNIPHDNVVLVEGPLDAIWLQEAGFPAVAVLGSRLSVEQLTILHDLNFRSIILCFDNDAPGRVATAVAVRLIGSAALWAWSMSLPSKYKDIQEVPIDEIPAIYAARHVAVNEQGLVPRTLQRWLSQEFVEAEASSIWRH